MPMDSNKEYFAFISYKREDEKWAKWVAHELEHYRLPATLNGKELPKNLRPIFRDVDELSAGNLPKQIFHALSISRNLIVICSPRAAQSEWVNKEIKDFIRLKGGKVDNVYPFIVEGAVFPDNVSKACFPEALRDLVDSEERLGGNINEQGGRHAALVKIVAGMLGLNFDTLWQKHERERKRRRFIAYSFILILFVLSVFLTLFFNSQNRNLLLSQSRFIAEKAELLIKEGDSYLAQLLLLDVLPNGKFYDRPYAVEAELALRKALKEKTKKLPHSDIACIDVALNPNDKYVIGKCENDTLYVWKLDNGELEKKIYLKNYPKDILKLPEKVRYWNIEFISDTHFFYADSVAHIWDIETGNHIRDISLDSIEFNTFSVRDNYFDISNNKIHSKWDISTTGEKYITQKQDGFLYVIDDKEGVEKKIEIYNPLFAVFTPNADEILIVTDNSIIKWSMSEHRVCREIPYDIEKYPYTSLWERKSIYLNKRMTKLVMKNFVNGGRYNSVENWVLYDLESYIEDPIISYSPIIFSSDGKTCIYDKADLLLENPDYCIIDIEDNIESSVEEIKLIDDRMSFWEWIGNNGNGYFIAYDGDSLLYIEENSFSIANKEAEFEGKVLGFSLNKEFFITTYSDRLIVYNNESNKIKSLNISKQKKLYSAEISSNGKYILTCHEDVIHTLDPYGWKDISIYYNYYLWDIDKETKTSLGRFNDYIDLHFNASSELIISSSGEIYDIRNKTTCYLQDLLHSADGISVSRDGKYYAIWNGLEGALWDSKTKKRLWTFNYGNPYSEINYLEFSPNSNELLVCYRYGVFILSIETGEIIDICACGESASAFYSSEGNSIYILTGEGCFKYDYPTLDELIKTAKQNLNGRRLTYEERVKYYIQ